MTTSEGTKNADDDYLPELARRSYRHSGGDESYGTGLPGRKAGCSQRRWRTKPATSRHRAWPSSGSSPRSGTTRSSPNCGYWRSCIDGFGYPGEQIETINILLDSPGGSLDSAFKIVRYLTCYARELHRTCMCPGGRRARARCWHLAPPASSSRGSPNSGRSIPRFSTRATLWRMSLPSTATRALTTYVISASPR